MKPAPVYSTERNGSLRLDVRRYADGRYGFDYTPPGTSERIKVRLNEPKAARARALEIITAGDGGKLAPHEKSEYAEFLQWKAQRRAAKPVPELVEDFITAKQRKGVSEAHMEGLKYLRTFAKSITGNVAEVYAAEVVAFIDEQKVGPQASNAAAASEVRKIYETQRLDIRIHRIKTRRGRAGEETTPRNAPCMVGAKEGRNH